MESTEFETLKFNPFDTSQNSILFQTFNFLIKTIYKTLIHLNTEEVNTCLQTADDTDFDKLKNFLSRITHAFGVICISESWCSNDSFVNNSNFQLPNYLPVSFERKTNKRGGGGIINFLHKKIMFKVRNDLSVSDVDQQ